MNPIVLFAFNNEDIDYGTLALCSISGINKHLKNFYVKLVTNKETMDQMTEKWGEVLPQNTIVQYTDREEIYSKFQYRKIGAKKVKWRNFSRPELFSQDMFFSDEEYVVMMDCDYMVNSNMLDLVYGSDENFFMNKKVKLLDFKEIDSVDQYVSWDGPPLYWATLVCYNRLDNFSQHDLFFDTVKHIRDKWSYYADMYGFNSSLYRNDISFSIAVHMLSGMSTEYPIAKPFPQDYILTALPKDELVDVEDGKYKFLHNARNSNSYLPVTVKDTDIHIMNKDTLLLNAEKIMKMNGLI